MPKFKIVYDSITLYELKVEAKTLEDAREIARDTDDGDFTVVYNSGDWKPRPDLDEKIK